MSQPVEAEDKTFTSAGVRIGQLKDDLVQEYFSFVSTSESELIDEILGITFMSPSEILKLPLSSYRLPPKIPLYHHLNLTEHFLDLGKYSY